jgi:CheY-like chemotaxis protein
MLNKIFLVDDDSVAIMINKKLIEKVLPGIETVSALNGSDAIGCYESWLESQETTPAHPNLILLDLNMPIMDGWDFLEEFSKPKFKSFSQTKVVVLSSSIDPLDIERSKQYSMVVDFIAKPVTMEILERYSL